MLFRLSNGRQRERIAVGHIYPKLWGEGELEAAIESLRTRDLIVCVGDDIYWLTNKGRRVLAAIQRGATIVATRRDLTAALFEGKLTSNELSVLKDTPPYRMAYLAANSLRRWPRTPRS